MPFLFRSWHPGSLVQCRAVSLSVSCNLPDSCEEILTNSLTFSLWDFPMLQAGWVFGKYDLYMATSSKKQILEFSGQTCMVCTWQSRVTLLGGKALGCGWVLNTPIWQTCTPVWARQHNNDDESVCGAWNPQYIWWWTATGLYKTPCTLLLISAGRTNVT